jgi:DnaJ-class molecular chaperone
VTACPVCNGAGTVSRPPWVAGDQMSWTDTGAKNYPCRACDGKGVLPEEKWKTT